MTKIIICLCSFLIIDFSLAKSIPDLFLLQSYKEKYNSDISGWLMSEKLDGVRAYWDGKKLYSRQGNVFAAPDWFINQLPSFPLDGELWAGRKNFEGVVSIVRKQRAHDGWKHVTYQIFEVPNALGTLPERLNKLKRFLAINKQSHINIIKQTVCLGLKHLNDFSHKIEKLGGEGVVIRDPLLDYYTGRTSNALKVKQTQDAECVVTGYKAGKGKYKGKVGALYCQMDDKLKLTIGSGLNDGQRLSPPTIGSRITFKYYGLTKNDKPRFPVFLRLRVID